VYLLGPSPKHTSLGGVRGGSINWHGWGALLVGVTFYTTSIAYVNNTFFGVCRGGGGGHMSGFPPWINHWWRVSQILLLRAYTIYAIMNASQGGKQFGVRGQNLQYWGIFENLLSDWGGVVHLICLKRFYLTIQVNMNSFNYILKHE
jgi:hypothetical protein